MTEKQLYNVINEAEPRGQSVTYEGIPCTARTCVTRLNRLTEENEQLKKGMIEVVDRYIKNVECNPPSSARTYGKIKGALVNIREDLRSLISDFE